MNKFEELIKWAIRKSGRIEGNPSGPFEHGFNIGEFCSAVLAVETKTDAKSFYKGYVAFLRPLPASEKSNPRNLGDEDMARSNIGWVFGEGMSSRMIAIWSEATGASHPVFGSTTPTPGEAFRIGKKIGQALARKGGK